MKKCTHLFFICTLALLVLTATPLPAADIAIIKSNNITPYNQAIAGFVQEVGVDVSQYNLQGKSYRAPGIIKKIKRQPPKLVFALGALAAVKAKESLSQIPIIYTLVLTPENKSLTAGKNITGLSIEVSPRKQFSALKRVAPEIKKIGVLYSHLTENLIFKAQKNCQTLGLELVGLKLSRAEDVPAGVKLLLASVDALWLIPDSVVVNQESLHYILLLTLENKIPFMVYSKNFVKAGALLSPVVNYTHLGRQAGKLARQFFKGKHLPAAILPPARVEWALNLHIAQNMGLRIPYKVLRTFKYVYR